MYFFERALLPSGWAENVRFSVSDGGIISAVAVNAAKSSADHGFGTAIPGIPNVHSHAFQRAMAGLAEHRVSANDTFWVWRDTMYRFANRITPENLRQIAAQSYVEMLKAGYTSVAEFHYVHHQRDGRPYRQPAEMSFAVLEAAHRAGIRITLLPVLYMQSGFDGRELLAEQQRFGHEVGDYLSLLRQIDAMCRNRVSQSAGVALHSLRAVAPDAIAQVLRELDSLSAAVPVHIHVAEQMQEVEQCLQSTGKRPVQWLIDNHGLNERWCVIHATHMNDSELAAVARSGAVVCICPTTEANLGDGIFSLEAYLGEGGRIAIGSDSNSSISPVEELRWLEYIQRLHLRRRHIAASGSTPSCGRFLIERVLEGGSLALGQKTGRLEPGYQADIVVLDDNDPVLAESATDSLLDKFVFSGNRPLVRHVMVGGEWRIRDYRHRDEDRIAAEFRAALRDLRMQPSITP